MNTTAEENKLAISDIKRHDFETAKNALEKYTQNSNKSVKLKTVDSDGGLFNWFSHKVTGDEMNELTTQIQSHIITLNGVDHELFDQIRQVYIALDALDSEYITAIVDSISAIKNVNDKTIDNQKDIQKSVANQEKTIDVLKKFKADIDRLKHITDVDKVWELIEDQSSTLLILQQHSDELSQIIHLKDVDTLWTNDASTKKKLDDLSILINNLDQTLNKKIQLLNDFKDKIMHLGDVDQMWDDIETHKTAIKKTNEQLTASIAALDAKIAKTTIHFEEVQKESSYGLKSEINKVQKDLQTKLDTFQSTHQEDINELTDSVKQDKQFLVEEIENVKRIQEGNENKVARLLEETTDLINMQKEKFSIKLRIAYTVAGGAVVISIIHFILNLVGLI